MTFSFLLFERSRNFFRSFLTETQLMGRGKQPLATEWDEQKKKQQKLRPSHKNARNQMVVNEISLRKYNEPGVC